jgi:hypothetical protein
MDVTAPLDSVLAFGEASTISGRATPGSTRAISFAFEPEESETIKDITAPLIDASANPTTLWPPNGQRRSVTTNGTISDDISGVDGSSAGFTVADEYGLVEPSAEFAVGPDGRFEFTTELVASRRGGDADGRSYSVRMEASDHTGNTGSEAVVVTVPHERSGK